MTCSHPNHYVFNDLVETKNGQYEAGEKMIPRPFAMGPPLEAYQAYTPGDLVTCNLVLISEVINTLTDDMQNFWGNKTLLWSQDANAIADPKAA
ncbi:MAG: hypothetical protein ETSY2_43100 [Candidatus Entotheonella gemina]|uniref:Uncharacterized protein n=1 Tax=Candidatus Entotheonella gemina TaxID=1429439 RepID=W4LKL0_9BACT|nr:MAG: hypothetical protein ETSY2_43100 [Candidatus Entotheonella gemina]